MLDTLEALFSGQKELFKGLYIEDKWNFEDTYPVIHLDMSLVVGKDLGSVKQEIRAMLLEIAKQHSVEIYNETYIIDLQFTSLIYALYNKYGKRVVILIDEYDYPLLNNLEEAAFDEISDLVYNFYGPLKSEGESIRFCFLSGITRYTSNTIFSGFNNANEISEAPRYADLCGFTDEKVDRYFTPYFEKYFEEVGITSDEEKKAFRERVREYYGGYRFVADSDTTFYNPTSLSKFVGNSCTFDSYWTAKDPGSLAEKLVRSNIGLFEGDIDFEIPGKSMTVMDLQEFLEDGRRAFKLYSYLKQIGYLTIECEDSYGWGNWTYPNREAKELMARIIRGDIKTE